MFANLYTYCLKLSVSKFTIVNSGILVRFAHKVRQMIKSRAIEQFIDLIIPFDYRIYNGTN